MAAAISAVPSGGLNSDNADAPRLRTLSITTALNKESESTAISAPSWSDVSTPTSSCSTAPPIAIRPGTSSKPPTIMAEAPAVSPAPASQPNNLISMTSKEWVVPPRPKPGRKPATDTPPTKRKAQNRAAQRAFRERRAARVGELEEQLEEEKQAHERAVRELQERISHLEIETQTLQSKCQWLEAMLEKERRSRDNAARTWDNLQVPAPAGGDGFVPAQTQPQSSPISQTMRPLQPAPPRNAVAHSTNIAEPRPVAQPFSISQIVSPPEEATEEADLACGSCRANGPCACAEEVLRDADLTMGCGKCSLGTRCECLEETLRDSAAVPDLKRPLPPSSPPSTSPEEKRQRSDAGLVMETDFTAMFASQGNKEAAPSILPPPAQSQLQPLVSTELRDPCGFCKEGTYCVCADSMLSPVSLAALANQQLAEQIQTHTPPPSEHDVVPTPVEVTASGAIKLPGLRGLPRSRAANAVESTPLARTGGCGPNGPGTCAQCLADPKSGLFCRSLAANFEKNNASGCSGNGGPGGCCKAGPPRDPNSAPAAAGRATADAAFGLSLSCADAYKTLASHRHFDEAADDIGSWLPKLKALPVPRPGGTAGGHGGRGHGSGGRAPIEVEAASIMSVLKDFDVRFGRGE
ncbi:hypothetical protein VTK56DRAFT_2279 [Thermocarpiscus australiensis]